MNVVVVNDIDDATEPGSVEIRYQSANAQLGNGVVGLAICCPGCGNKSYLPVGDNRGWNLASEEPLTITPSVFHTKEKGGCGWHGFLTDGEWRSC